MPSLDCRLKHGRSENSNCFQIEISEIFFFYETVRFSSSSFSKRRENFQVQKPVAFIDVHAVSLSKIITGVKNSQKANKFLLKIIPSLPYYKYNPLENKQVESSRHSNGTLCA